MIFPDVNHIKCSDNTSCNSCFDDNSRETLEHFLFTCPAYQQARLKLTRTTKRDATHLGALLSKVDNTPHVMTFIVETGRFPRLSKDLKALITNLDPWRHMYTYSLLSLPVSLSLSTLRPTLQAHQWPPQMLTEWPSVGSLLLWTLWYLSNVIPPSL